MMKNRNQMKVVYSKNKGWFWFVLIVIFQVTFIFVNYIVMNTSL
ncbi:KGW motif small protein [Acinetobacter soli]|nr:KGW motif small protein [Acinetobacter soli]